MANVSRMVSVGMLLVACAGEEADPGANSGGSGSMAPEAGTPANGSGGKGVVEPVDIETQNAGAGGNGMAGGPATSAEPEYDFGPNTSLRLPPCEPFDLEVGVEGPDGVKYLYKSAGTDVVPIGMTDDRAYLIDTGRLLGVSLQGGAEEDLGPFDYEGLHDQNVLVWGNRIFWVTGYYSDDPKDIWSAPLSDFSAAAVLQANVGALRNLTADDEYLYWWGYDTRETFRIPVTGGEPETFLTGVIPNGMISHGGFLYFIDDYLYRVPTTGGTPEYLADAHFEALFDAEGDTVYWTDQNNDSVNWFALGASRTQMFASFADGTPTQPRVAGGQVYFTQFGGEFTTFAGGCNALFTSGVTYAEQEYEYVTQGFLNATVWLVDSTHVYLMGDDGVYAVPR